MLQKTQKASKGEKIKKIYFNDFGITRTLTLLIVMYLKNVFETAMLKFENKLQYNLPSGKKKRFCGKPRAQTSFSLGNVYLCLFV